MGTRKIAKALGAKKVISLSKSNFDGPIGMLFAIDCFSKLVNQEISYGRNRRVNTTG